MSNLYVNDFGTSVRTYYTELKKCKPLPKDKERELIIKAKGGDLDAQQQVLTANLKFVFSIAGRYKGNGAELSDLIAEGNMGLVKAIEKFDVEKDVKFISYAVWWIRNSIQEFIKKRQIIQQIEGNDDILDVQINMGKFGEDDEDEPITRREIMLPMEEDENQSLVEQKQKMILDKILSKLDKRERFIVESYYGIGGKKEMNLEEIGNVLGITKERVRQIKELSFRKLRTEILMLDVADLFSA